MYRKYKLDIVEITDLLRNTISIQESNSQGYTNRDKIPILWTQSQTTMSPNTATIPSPSSERRVVSPSMGYHGFHKESSPLNRFHKVLDAIHAPPIAYHRWYVQLTFRARDRRYRLGRGRHERWFPRCHIEFHLGIQFRVRMTFFVFLAGWNIAFFRKAFLPSRHGAASYPRWNEIPRPICHRVIRLSFKEKKRSDRIEERKTSRIVFRTRVLKFEYCGVAFKIGRIYSKTVRRNKANIYRRSWFV